MIRDTNDQVLLVATLAENLPEHSSLDKILIGYLGCVCPNSTNPFVVFLVAPSGMAICAQLTLEVDLLERGPHIIGIIPIVGHVAHRTVTLVRRIDLTDWPVAWKLLIIDTEAVSSGVGVGKHPSLQHYMESADTVLPAKDWAYWGLRRARCLAPLSTVKRQLAQCRRSSFRAVGQKAIDWSIDQITSR